MLLSLPKSLSALVYPFVNVTMSHINSNNVKTVWKCEEKREKDGKSDKEKKREEE